MDSSEELITKLNWNVSLSVFRKHCMIIEFLYMWKLMKNGIRIYKWKAKSI